MTEAYFIYDGSFEGLLTAVFDSFAQKRLPIKIVQRQRLTQHLFGEELRVISNSAKADRVAKKLREISPDLFCHLALAFTSRQEGVEMLLFNLIVQSLKAHRKMQESYGGPDQLRLHELSKLVQNEMHRQQALVQFYQLNQAICMSTIDPDYDVLPFLGGYFQNHFAHQQWVIYDTAHGYGLHHNLHTLSPFAVNDEQLLRNLPDEHLPHEEQMGRQLWANYFKPENGPVRKQTAIHHKLIPQQYWKHLSNFKNITN